MAAPETISVAIACQGGGAQTAFTAGALAHLLKQQGKPTASGRRFEITALSGTSGGAVCAALAWRDLVLKDRADKTPTVEAFWKAPYPEGNRSLPHGEALLRDLGQLLARGDLPLHALDRLRSDASQAALRLPSMLTAGSPVDLAPELRPYAFARTFDLVDVLVPPALARMVTEATRANLALMGVAAPQLANLVGQMLDWLPFHQASLLDDDQPSLLRRECDIQDAFRAVLTHYFDAPTLAALQHEARRPVPELLVAATDARSVHEPADRSGTRHEVREAHPDDPPGPGEESIRRSRKLIEAARKRGIDLEPHEHHRASMTNRRVFRATSDPTQLVERILASAAIPTVMRAVALHGETLWDGLYCSNPPIYDLPDVHGHEPAEMDRNPQEIWVIRINPTQRAGPLESMPAIHDRRNELSGNLPLAQEIRSVLAIGGAWKSRRYYRPIVFGFIDMDDRFAAGLDQLTKVDKRAETIDRLFDHGQAQAEDFQRRWAA